MTEQPGAPTSSPKKERSPSFPFIDLKEAVARAEQLYAAERRNVVAPAVAAGHWNYSAKSSAVRQTIAALRAFGLLEKRGEGLALTNLALDIVMEGSPGRQESIKKAALFPDEFRAVWSRYAASGLPSDKQLQFDLVRSGGFTEAGAEDFISNVRSTISFASLSPGGKIPPSPEDKRGQGMRSGPQISNREDVNEVRFDHGSIPPMTFPLPRGNVVEFRLKAPVTAQEFKIIQTLVEAWRASVVREEPAPKAKVDEDAGEA